MGLLKDSKKLKDSGQKNCDVVINDCTNKIGGCSVVTYTNDMAMEEAKKFDKEDCKSNKNDELFAGVLKLILAKLDKLEADIQEIKKG